MPSFWMEASSLASQSPYQSWYFGGYVVVRIAMVALHVDEATSWLWFDSKQNARRPPPQDRMLIA